LRVISDVGDDQTTRDKKLGVERRTPEDDYYFVHIDIVKNKSRKAAHQINDHMFKCCSFDPRRHSQFPYYHLTDKLNLKQKSQLAGGTYELWQVHKNFSLEEFQKMVAQLPGPETTPEKKPIVRIVCMFSGRCTVNEYDSQQ